MEGVASEAEAIEMAPGSGRRSSRNAVVLRHIALLQALPPYPRTIVTTALQKRLEEQGFATSARTIQRDLVSFRQLLPIELAGAGRPYRWRWKRDADPHPLPVPIEGAPVRLVALVYPALLHRLGNVRGTLQGDGRVRVSMTIASGPALTRWVLGLGDGIEVLQPKALREQIAEIASRVAATYSPLGEDRSGRE